MKQKWMKWAAVTAFVFGLGISFNSVATGGCNTCYLSCKAGYSNCIASGGSATYCQTQYVYCRAECPC